jgi:GTP cyclohydrolase II
MLMSLKIESVRLITNNPKKIQQLIDYGINVSDRIPHIMEPNEYNRFYLETKAAKSGHLIDFRGQEHLSEQSDRPFIKGMSELEVGVLNE